MNLKSPSYAWYPRDFAADEPVVLMTLEEEGAYRRLLDHQWLHESIPSDLRQIAAICKGVPLSRMRQLWSALQVCFVPSEKDADRLVNPRMERQRKRAEEYRRNQSQNGKRGGRPSKPEDTE